MRRRESKGSAWPMGCMDVVQRNKVIITGSFVRARKVGCNAFFFFFFCRSLGWIFCALHVLTIYSFTIVFSVRNPLYSFNVICACPKLK